MTEHGMFAGLTERNKQSQDGLQCDHDIHTCTESSDDVTDLYRIV